MRAVSYEFSNFALCKLWRYPSCGLEMNWETLQEDLICGFLKAFLVCA